MFDVINPGLFWLGVAGISLPILAHLLSKRKYDVVNWGAMQFLELRQNARRKILLEQLLLLFLRIGLIVLLALAFMRPWAEGSWFSRAISSKNRDVVLVIDGSYSMGWEDGGQTPHQSAVQIAQRLLDDLGAGNAVALIDARDKPRAVIEVPTRDLNLVREELNRLPSPAGKADLPLALRKAVQILSRTNNLSREVIVLTDRQAQSWRADDRTLWRTFDDQLEQPAVRPRVWVVELGDQNSAARANFSVGRLKLNREVTAAGYPVKVKAKIRYRGKGPAMVRKVFLEVDGQRLAEKTQSKRLSPGGDATVEFEYAFPEPGSHRLRVVLEDDNLPGDNHSEAVVVITEALPVLLVDGDPHPEDFIRGETVFAHSALTPEENPAPWVKAEVVEWNRFSERHQELDRFAAVVLANVPRLSEADVTALSRYVSRGGGVFFALGDRVEKAFYNSRLYRDGAGLLPVSLQNIEENKDENKQTVQVANGSLQASWLQRFRLEADSDLCEARFSHRWKVVLAPRRSKRAATVKPPGQDDSKGNTEGRNASAGPQEGRKPETGDEAVVPGDAFTVAELTTGEPFLVTRKYGRGRVVLMSTALDGDWGTLPAKDDYTPLLHEIIFYLASTSASRNVDVGTPLVLERPEKEDLRGFAFFGPGETVFDYVPGGVQRGRQVVRLNDTSLPGLYAFRRKTSEGKPDIKSPAEFFVVNSDRSESDLTPLTEEQRTTLQKPAEGSTEEPRMMFMANRQELTAAMFRDDSRSEFWWLLLLLFLGVLVFEVVMTRKMVQGGHAVTDEAEPPPLAPETRNPPGTRTPPPLPGSPASRAPSGRSASVPQSAPVAPSSS